MRNPAFAATLLALLLTLPAPAPLTAQDQPGVFTATITAFGTGQPVPGARVTVADGAYGALTDAGGRVRIGGVPPGSYVATVEAFGYQPERFSLELAPGGVVEADVALLIGAFRIAPLTVAVTAPSRGLARTGFFARERGGFGTFLMPDEIAEEAKRGARLVDVLRTVPGLRVIPISQPARSGYTVVSSRPRIGGYCQPRVYLDGARYILLDEFELESIIPLSMVSGIEVYPSAAATPPQFMGEGTCGAIAIWTRQ